MKVIAKKDFHSNQLGRSFKAGVLYDVNPDPLIANCFEWPEDTLKDLEAKKPVKAVKVDPRDAEIAALKAKLAAQEKINEVKPVALSELNKAGENKGLQAANEGKPVAPSQAAGDGASFLG